MLTAPTCTVEGKATHACVVCGEVQTYTMPATGHTEVILPGKPASCLAMGLSEGKQCGVCQLILVAQEAIEKTDHIAVVKPGRIPTCNSEGLTDGEYCSACSLVLKEQTTLPKTEHTLRTIPGYEATCAQPGLTDAISCTICYAVIQNHVAIPAKGHREVLIPAVRPTCTTDGNTPGYRCSACGLTTVEPTPLPAQGHVETLLSATTPTCTKNGLTEGKYCIVCKTTTVVQQTVPARGHTEVVDPAVEPNCTYTGLTEGKHCTFCNEITVPQLTIPAKGHDFKEQKCTVCGVIQASSNLSYSLNSDKKSYTVTGIGACTDAELAIPATYNNLPVTAIASSAFRKCTQLVSVLIPDSVITIGGSAFNECLNLKTVRFGSGVKSIGEYAFANTAITVLTLPDSLESIGRFAFQAVSMTTVVVPDSVTSIGVGAFMGCNSLTEITLPFIGYSESDSTPFGCIFGYGNVDGNHFTSHKQGYTSQNGIEYFIPETLRKVTVTKDVIVQDYAFHNCDLIEVISLPTGMTYIGGYAFSNCVSLKSIQGKSDGVLEIPETVTYLGTGAFDICRGFVSLSVHMTGNIGETAFRYCTGLQNIAIGDSVTGIGRFAFQDTVITKIVVPDSVTSIGVGAFMGCNFLVEMTLPFVGSSATADGYSGTFGNIFGYETTKDNTLILTSEKKGYTYQYVSSGTYYRYYIPETLRKVVITLDQTIPTSAFEGCDLIEEIVIPADTTQIAAYAFKNCRGLKRLNSETDGTYYIPPTVKVMGNFVFENNYGLDTVGQIGEVLGTNAFCNCIHLKEIALDSNSLFTTLPNYVFNGCIGLTEMTVPENVTAIGVGAFLGCNSLVEMTLPFIGYSENSNEPFGYIFGHESAYAQSILTTSMKKGYTTQTSANGSKYNYYIPETLRKVTITKDEIIQSFAFQNCDLIEVITLPAGITSIGEIAFSNCASLKSIEGKTDGKLVIPETVTILGRYAFDNCQGFVSLTVDMTGAIGDYAFRNCVNVVEILLGDKVTGISSYAFENTKISDIIVPDNVTSIGAGAFMGCNSLVEMTLPFIGSSENYNEPFGYVFGHESAYAQSILTTSMKKGYTTQTSANGSKYNYYIPETLRKVTITKDEIIQSFAFQNCDLIEVITLPAGITSIGEIAFSNCASLKSIEGKTDGKLVIPETVTILGRYAFDNCQGFVSLTVDMTGAIGDYAFRNCVNVVEILLGDKVTGISSYAFENTQISDIIVPDNVTSIRTGAFMGCNNLVEMTLPFIGADNSADEITTFGYIFGYKSSSVSYTGKTSSGLGYTTQIYSNSYYGFYIPTTLRRVTITKDLVIQAYAFQNCDMLDVVALPENLVRIGSYALGNMTNLSHFYYAGSVSNWEGVTLASDWNQGTNSYHPIYNAKEFGPYFDLSAVRLQKADRYMFLLPLDESVNIKILNLRTGSYMTLAEAGVKIEEYYNDQDIFSLTSIGKLTGESGGFGSIEMYYLDGNGKKVYFNDDYISIFVVDQAVNGSMPGLRFTQSDRDYIGMCLDLFYGLYKVEDPTNYVDNTDMNMMDMVVYSISDLSGLLSSLLKGDPYDETTLKNAFADFIQDYVDSKAAHNTAVNDTQAMKGFITVIEDLTDDADKWATLIGFPKEILEFMDEATDFIDKMRDVGLTMKEYERLEELTKKLNDYYMNPEGLRNPKIFYEFMEKHQKKVADYREAVNRKKYFKWNDYDKAAAFTIFTDEYSNWKVVYDSKPGAMETGFMAFEFFTYVRQDYAANIEILLIIRQGLINEGYGKKDIEIRVIDNLIDEYQNKWLTAIENFVVSYCAETIVGIATKNPVASVVSAAASVLEIGFAIDSKVEINTLNIFSCGIYKCLSPIDDLYYRGEITSNSHTMRTFLDLYLSIMTRSNEIAIRIARTELDYDEKQEDLERIQENIDYINEFRKIYLK